MSNRLEDHNSSSMGVGLFISIVVILQLANLIMQGGLSESITLLEFLSPTNIIFCFYMGVIFLCGWTFYGHNNRSIVVWLGITYTLNLAIYFALFGYFFYISKNIYVLNFMGVAAALPTIIILNYRRAIYFYILNHMVKKDLLSYWAQKQLFLFRLTQFEVRLRWTYNLIFFLEFCFSLYLTISGLLLQVSPTASISQALINNDYLLPWDSYYLLLNILTCVVAGLLIRTLRTEKKNKDKTLISLSEDNKRKILSKFKN